MGTPVSPVEEGTAGRDRLLDALNPHSPNALDDDEIDALSGFLAVIRAHESSVRTPVEDGIVNIVKDYVSCARHGSGMTPDNMLHWIESTDGCRIWFDDAVAVARRFRRTYKHLLDKADAEAHDETEPV